MPYPKISIQNSLKESVWVYDSFAGNNEKKNLANYFGTLTKVAQGYPGATETLEPIHGPISTYIIYDEKGNPIKRVFTLGMSEETFTVAQSDVDIINSTKTFVDLIEKSPDDPLIKNFQKIIKNGQASAEQINRFFQDTTDYKNCTFISYMLVVTTIARTPATQPSPAEAKKSQPVEGQAYSLSALCKYMGTAWPSGLPDISVTDFYCKTDNDQLHLGGKLNLKDVTFADGVIDHVLSIIPSTHVWFSIVFNYGANLGAGTLALQFILDNLRIPVGSDKTIDIDKPTIALTISPLFKFVVFEIKATMPFSLFNSPPFDAQIAMTIDNVEAEIGITLDGDKHTLLTPPVIKGVHFDQIGVGMGLFFEPPGFALGVEGKFHIGSGSSIVSLDDDTFAVVCQLEEEIPNPLYLSFYVPKLNLDQVMEIFTNKSCDLDFPISFSDLSFRWAENPMEPVTLPDGSLAPMGFGFSAYMDLFGLSFYGDLEIDLAHGIQGDLCMDPFSLGGKLFSLTGNGKAVTIKVDPKGNPIRNNYIPENAAEKKAVANAKTEQLIKSGGPALTVSTSRSPYFSLDAKLDFLGFNDAIDVVIEKQGIIFDLEFGTLISTKMACKLKDYHNFTGTFSYGPDWNIPLPVIAGMHLGHIRFKDSVDATIEIISSLSDIDFSASGGFVFEGTTKKFGPVSIDIDISSITDVLGAIWDWIKKHIEQLFSDIINDADKWANLVFSDVITPLGKDVQHMSEVLHKAFGKPLKEIGNLLQKFKFQIDDVASALKNAYQPIANDLAGALATACRAGQTEVCNALKKVGYGAKDIAGALKGTFSLDDKNVAIALEGMGYPVGTTLSALTYAFPGIVPDVAETALKGAGYEAGNIADAFRKLGGNFADSAQKAADGVKKTAEKAADGAKKTVDTAVNDVKHWLHL